MFTFLSAVNELCSVLIAALIVNVSSCHINCICFSCSLGFSVFTKKTPPKNKYLPERLKAADKASPLIVDRGTRTRQYDGHLPSFQPWKESCLLMWQSGQVTFHFTHLCPTAKTENHVYSWSVPIEVGCFLHFLTNPVTYIKTLKSCFPPNIFNMSPAEASVPDWLTSGPRHMAELVRTNRPAASPDLLSPCVTAVEEIWILYSV